jgi:putative tricarboxylic transport membrane protein
LIVDDLGMIVAMIASLTICALGTPETRWREFSVFLILMIAGSVALFVWLLGMPIPVWPSRVPGFITYFFR